jgi:hypothetical protein
MKKWSFLLLLFFFGQALNLPAQELDCKVTVNHSQIQGTNAEVFTTLEKSLNELMSNTQWTQDHYATNEHISCNMLINVKEYSNDIFKCELIVQSNRPIYGTSYQSILWNFRDVNFQFTYKEFDQLEFRMDQITDNLTAELAFYAYLIIGLDMDSMAPMGGTAYLQTAENIVNAAQSLSESGWKAFDDSRNRYAIINDYLDTELKPLRQAIYTYHRLGLDQMATNAGRGRSEITNAITLLKQAKENKPLSSLIQIFTEIKKNELVNIYSQGTTKEKEDVYQILSDLNPSQRSTWDKIKSSN